MPNSAKAALGKHKPVLLHESLEVLNLKAGETFLDGTFGSGGHSREVLRHFPDVHIIGLDRDPEVARDNPDIKVRMMSFADVDKLGIKPDAILLDLGISTDQLENSGRGFSFLRDEPLDMRMSKEGLTASDILNSWDEHAIELILRGFGEEKFSRKIAKEIVKRRNPPAGGKPFKTTFDLVEAITEAKPKNWQDKINPATKTFQALRIAVNEELTALEAGLEKGFKTLNTKGRFAVISFHSLEDRIVKNFFRNLTKQNLAKAITKKPIRPSVEEIEKNPRSRSAKLRVIEKI